MAAPAPPVWREVQLETHRDAVEVVAAAAAEIAAGVEVRDAGTVIRTAPDRAIVIVHVAPGDVAGLHAAVDDALARARDAGVTVDPVVVRERDAHEDEWRDVWKQFFRATRVGRSFIVRPSWDPGAIADGDRVIDLDPGRAFGTGGHASTRLVITLAEDVSDRLAAAATPVRRFLDLGCGSGILSIAAARLWPDAAGVAVDVDADATACARENFERNGVRSVALATGSADAVPAGAPFDVVLANIQADVLSLLAREIAPIVAPGGAAILSGLLLPDAAGVQAAFEAAGFTLAARRDEGEWAALEMRRAGVG